MIALLALVISLGPAQTSCDRLAATTKIWRTVKYFHPRVTAADIDWDRAFVIAAPKVPEKTDEEFAAAVDVRLGALKDPKTRGATTSSGQT